ncbi:MAG: helix-turn-helix transcriptional regulator [Firmicutes bacterium]|nr:helix-turn-helix transcriptional regulator [Bacillota bacterium]
MAGEDPAFWRAVGLRIRHFRRRQGWSVDRLAREVDVTRNQIVRLEAGVVGTPVWRLAAIARALGVTMDDLLQDVAPTGVSAASPTDQLMWSLRAKGLDEADIARVIDYIRLLEAARSRKPD